MWQIRLKSILQNLGLLSIYLLFLSVQLNLKYTFPNAVFSDHSNSTLSNEKAETNVRSVEKPVDGKPFVQKLRLNKRYVHENVFLVYSLIDEFVSNFNIKVSEAFTPTPQVCKVPVCHAWLRGPPQVFPFSC
jgi:hypothetical protein